MTLVVTGRLAVRGITRNEFKDLVEASGGELVERWSNSVQLVVLGDKPGDNKIQKAIELGVPIMSEADFWNKYS
jgi:DNA ligase (NAD+)